MDIPVLGRSSPVTWMMWATAWAMATRLNFAALEFGGLAL
jgi:hypothetical protein